MDTAAYLTNQGWLGDGHALHHSGRGITKPILVSQKQNVLGIGKKKHDAHADQWWARAFDATLKGINATKDQATGRIEGISLGVGAQALQMVGKGGGKWVAQRGLYSNFVRGEGLNGTLTTEEEHKSDINDQGRRPEVCESGGPKSTVARRTKHQESSKPRRQRGKAVLVSDSVGHKATALGREEAESGPTRQKGYDMETKEGRRQRKKERRARRGLKIAHLSQKLPAQPDRDPVEYLQSAKFRRRQKEGLLTDSSVEFAVAEDTRLSNGASNSINRKRRRLVASGNG